MDTPASSLLHVIQPVGVLDSDTGKQLRQDLSNALAAGKDMILIDAQSISFMDSNGFSALVACLKKVREAGQRLALCSLCPQLKLVLEITGTDQIFQVYADRPSFDQSCL